MWGSIKPSLKRKRGGLLDDVLVSGIRSTTGTFVGSSSSPDSSSEDGGVVGRRGGGSLSPRAMIRVGGGGSLLEPRALRSLAVTASLPF